MPCYQYSSNDPIYLDPNSNPWSIEIEHTPINLGPYSYAAIARLCDIPAADQICVFTKDGSNNEVQLSNFTINETNETITLATTPAVGTSKVIVRRCTPNNKLLVKFTDGAKLTSSQLNLVTHQLLFIAQEKQFKDANVTSILPVSLTAWSATINYSLGDFVQYNNKVYKAILDPTVGQEPGVATTVWQELANVTSSSGFLIKGPTTQPVTFDFSGITTGQTLIWQNNQFVPGVPNANVIIADNSITSSKLSSTVGLEAVATSNIQALAITTAKIAESAITNSKIATGTITPDRLSVGKPVWDTSGNLTVTGNISTTSGTLTTSGLATVGGLSISSGSVSINPTTAPPGESNVKIYLRKDTNINGDLVVTGTIQSASSSVIPAFSYKINSNPWQVTAGTTLVNAAPFASGNEDLNIAIIKQKTTSRVLLTWSLSIEVTSQDAMFILERKPPGSNTWTEIGYPAGTGLRLRGIAAFPQNLGNQNQNYVFNYIDDSATTVGQWDYRLKIYGTGAHIVYVNRNSGDADNTSHQRTISTVTAQEIFIS
jgi:hypothetical protein